MKLSILLVSFNQLNFIDQCLDGIFLQEYDFDVELVVADDCSTDGTRERIKSRLAKEDLHVIFLEGKENMGLGKNYLRGIEACNGQYVAFLEGDDYWTDPKRLQKHVDFMERQPKCPMTCNPYAIFYQQNSQLSIPHQSKKSGIQFFTSKKLIQYNVIGNLSACVFRKTALKSIPKEWFQHNITDWFIGIYLAQSSSIVQLNEIMSVYRVNLKGLWSNYSSEDQRRKKMRLTQFYDFLLGYRFSHDFLAYRLASNLIALRDQLITKSPPPLEKLIPSFIPSGLLIRLSLGISFLVPKKMIPRNEEIYNIF